MTQDNRAAQRAKSVATWVTTALVALGIGAVGVSKFLQAAQWQSRFIAWGYPSWTSALIGVVEIVGVIGLCVPRVALRAAVLLLAVMLSALFTLVAHPGGPLGWGKTPLIYNCPTRHHRDAPTNSA